MITKSEQDMRETLQRLVNADTQKNVAESFEIAPSYLNDILQGKRSISPTLARRMGFEMERLYRAVEGKDGQK